MKQERCASQQNRRSSLLVPKLDLTKIKPYEDNAKKQKEKEILKKQLQTLQPQTNTKINNHQQEVAVKLVDSKKIEHYQQMESHLSQSLSLSPKIQAPKK